MVFKALECIKENPEYICKYLTPNDTGENGSHQSGIYINKADGRLLFTKSFKKGENVHSDIIIEYSDKSTPRVPDESTPDLVTNNPSYFTTGLY